MKSRFTFAEVPVMPKERIGGESNAVSFRSLRNMVKEYLAVMVSFYILRARDDHGGAGAVSR